jgi:hypothetical protein
MDDRSWIQAYFDGAQKRIIEPLKRVGIGVKDIAGETQTPYSTALNYDGSRLLAMLRNLPVPAAGRASQVNHRRVNRH